MTRTRRPGPSTVVRGRAYEAAAVRFLEAHGLRILGRNLRFGSREVDIVAREGGTICFIEVKGRATPAAGHPLAAITPAKRREVEAVARWWLRTHGPVQACRFDAVSVEGSGIAPSSWRIEHIRDAWRPGLA